MIALCICTSATSAFTSREFFRSHDDVIVIDGDFSSSSVDALSWEFAASAAPSPVPSPSPVPPPVPSPVPRPSLHVSSSLYGVLGAAHRVTVVDGVRDLLRIVLPWFHYRVLLTEWSQLPIVVSIASAASVPKHVIQTSLTTNVGPSSRYTTSDCTGVTLWWKHYTECTLRADNADIKAHICRQLKSTLDAGALTELYGVRVHSVDVSCGGQY